MSCDKCSNSAKKILDDMADRRWDDVVKLTESACRLRAINRAVIVISAILLCLCLFLVSRTAEHGEQIHALRGEVDSIHRILAEGVVVSETETTTETTTTTIEQDNGEGSGNNVYLDGDNATYNQTGGEK